MKIRIGINNHGERMKRIKRLKRLTKRLMRTVIIARGNTESTVDRKFELDYIKVYKEWMVIFFFFFLPSRRLRLQMLRRSEIVALLNTEILARPRLSIQYS